MIQKIQFWSKRSKKERPVLKIVTNAMSGSTNEETDKNMEKIISNVAKGVMIEKQV